MAKKNKKFENISDSDYQACWNMDVRLAGIICDYLRMFLQAEKAGPGGCPAIFESMYGREKCYKEWLNTIRKMIWAFDQYLATKWQIDKEPETQERIEEGMQLFIKYFGYLWI